MRLHGKQIGQLHQALMSAFDEARLAQMVRYRMEVTLSAVAKGQDLSEIVFNLIEWAEQRGRTWELLEKAHEENPGNEELTKAYKDLKVFIGNSPSNLTLPSALSSRSYPILRYWWILAIVIVSLVFIGRVIYTFHPQIDSNDGISFGEFDARIHTEEASADAKQMEQAAVAYGKGNYLEAERLYTDAFNATKLPEARIFMNNAHLGASKSIRTYTIAVVTSRCQKTQTGAGEMLQGVAQAQEEFNTKKENIGKVGVRVCIANDMDDKTKAVALAEKLPQMKNEEVLAVVGHGQSNLTYVTRDIYQKNEIVLMSSLCTAVDLFRSETDNIPNYLFRTVYSDKQTAVKLVEHLKETTKVAVFYCPNDFYSASLYRAFYADYTKNPNRDCIGYSLDIDEVKFDPDSMIDKAIKADVEALIFFPISEVRDKAIRLIDSAHRMPDKKRLLCLGGDTLDHYATLSYKTSQIDGLIAAVPWYWQPTKKQNIYKKFCDEAKQLWGKECFANSKVTWRTALTYDATSCLIKAIERLDHDLQNLNETEKKQPLTLAEKRRFIQKQFDPENNHEGIEGLSGMIKFQKNGERDLSSQDIVAHLIQVRTDKKTGKRTFTHMDKN